MSLVLQTQKNISAKLLLTDEQGSLYQVTTRNGFEFGL